MKIVHALSAALSLGGWFNVKPSDWGRVGSLTKWQYERLTNFANEIASGKQALDGRFTLRVNMYAKAARGTGEEIARAVAAENGYTKERRILGVADHCRTAGGLQGCVELAEKGWEPIGTLPRIGDTPCRTNCHCHFIYE